VRKDQVVQAIPRLTEIILLICNWSGGSPCRGSAFRDGGISGLRNDSGLIGGVWESSSRLDVALGWNSGCFLMCRCWT